LDAAVHGEREVVSFIKYSVDGLVEGLKEQIDYIRRQQWHVAWINYVHERFHTRNSPADARRRRLVLALSEKTAPVPIADLEKITTGLALEYHDKTPKTLMRDVNALSDMQLVVKLSNGTVKANREKILAFSVWRAADEIPEIPKLRAP
jgi:tRNA U38,U39,U40 pseudouridine synthase TruA